jgi:hypothetical protein
LGWWFVGILDVFFEKFSGKLVKWAVIFGFLDLEMSNLLVEVSIIEL